MSKYVAGDRLRLFRSFLSGINSGNQRMNRIAAENAQEDALKIRNVQLGIQGTGHAQNWWNYGDVQDVKSQMHVTNTAGEVVPTIKSKGNLLGFSKGNLLTGDAVDQGFTYNQASGTTKGYTLNVNPGSNSELPSKLTFSNPTQEARFFSTGKYYGLDSTGRINYDDVKFDYNPTNQGNYKNWVDTSDQTNFLSGKDFDSTFKGGGLSGDGFYTDYVAEGDKIFGGGKLPESSEWIPEGFLGKDVRDLTTGETLELRDAHLKHVQKDAYNTGKSLNLNNQGSTTSSIDPSGGNQNVTQNLGNQNANTNTITTASTDPVTTNNPDDLLSVFQQTSTDSLDGGMLVYPPGDANAGQPLQFASTGDIDTSWAVTKDQYDAAVKTGGAAPSPSVSGDATISGGDVAKNVIDGGDTPTISVGGTDVGDEATTGAGTQASNIATKISEKIVDGTTKKTVADVTKGISQGQAAAQGIQTAGKVIGGAASVYGIYSGIKALGDKKTSTKGKIGGALSIGAGVAGIAALAGLANPFTAPLAIGALAFGIMGGGGKINAEEALAPLRGKTINKKTGSSLITRGQSSGRSRKGSSSRSRRYA